MAIILSALDPNQVASATRFEVLLGEPAQRLIILSGVAVPKFLRSTRSRRICASSTAGSPSTSPARR